MILSSNPQQPALSPTEVDRVATADGALSITLPSALVKDISVQINGLVQRKSAYTVTANRLDLPISLNIISGDSITYKYYN
jgi:hypothetical protein